MKIAILSGKGGTGKTFVSVNLASIILNSLYVDCDIEEPDGHLFLHPLNLTENSVNVKIPHIDNTLCNDCRKCVEFCHFNALASIQHRITLFKDVCHSCGGCSLICPMNAISEVDRKIGCIQRGIAGHIEVLTGMLNPGETSGISIINRLMEIANQSKRVTIIDCPPGSSCAVMESIKDADYCLIVAEPTIFGSSNLKMIHQLVSLLHKKCGIVLNKCLDEDNPSEEYARQAKIKIVGQIPFDSYLATANSNGEIAVSKNEKYQKIFTSIYQNILREIKS
ncbi:MAG: ATP-binding protein [Bacilli bacterium]